MVGLILIALLFFIIVYLNLSVSYCVAFADGLSNKQKLRALLLCWLLPILGSCILLYGLLDDVPAIRSRGSKLGNLLFLSWIVALSSNENELDANGDNDVYED